MNCQTLQDQFDDRLDGRLDAAHIKEFDAHLAHCAPCQQQWQTDQAVWDVISHQPALEPTFGFATRTLRRLRETATAGRVWFWQLPVFRWATAGSLLVVIGMSGALTWRQHEIRREADLKVYESVQQGSIEDIAVISDLDKLEEVSNL